MVLRIAWDVAIDHMHFGLSLVRGQVVGSAVLVGLGSSYAARSKTTGERGAGPL
jgi:hypothetical protein